MKKLFGTDGIRGKANIWPMTTEVIMQVGRALAYVIKKRDHRHRVVVGKDTRLSGYMIETALTSGICSMGVDVLLIGPLPTPGVAFITSNMRADAGVMISASHNPYDDNGIKFFSREGFKLPDDIEKKIEDLTINNRHLEKVRPTATEIGKAFRIEDAIGRYIVFLKNTLPKGMMLDGMKIVLDCAHGAAYRIAPTVFSELGARLELLGVKPNGLNINENCGALYPEAARKRLLETGADFGLALDGDGDRAILIDEKGEILNGDKVLAICAYYLSRYKTLKNQTVVGTVMSNFGLEMALNSWGLKLFRVPVGDRYVVEALVNRDYNLGGEPSGHIVFLDHHTTGDGILTALQILAIMLSEDKPLSELSKLMEPVPQCLINVPVKRRPPLSSIPEIERAVRKTEEVLGKNGRVILRYSGTEPVARVMVEGTDEVLINNLASDIAEIIKIKLGS